MYLGITRVGSLSVADAESAQPSTSGRPVDDRVDSLISRIRPARHSEERRYRVAQYVSGIVARCFSADQEVQAFMFGSVPLKTYLPDGDIDLSVFQSSSKSLRDTWTIKLCSVLEDEQRDPYASFRVKDVQVIHAEVKLLKCLVDNIVVDISFETLGGLCTVAFLESIDRHIQGNHLFKRSVILVKAWCYYESRLLGAHHGLISTYALETMVLYIFNVHHRELKSPCQVLHKFLEVFSEFDWDKYCLSLQGPIVLSSFPDPRVEHAPEVHEDSLLLSEDFTDEMMEMYSPTRQKPSSDSKPFVSQASRSFPVKFLNIMDPLLPSNNLGRSVNKASFARIRKALAHGAHTLTSIVAKDEESAVPAIDKFFKNTWNAQRPMPKAPPQGTPHQPPASWQGNKPMYGYGSPVINIPPEHLQYWQQYQQQRMLHHLQQQQQQHQYQQQVQHAARHQQRSDQQPLPASASLVSHAQYNLQQLQQQPSQRQRLAMMPTANGHADPPARVASPFATHARTASSSSLAQPGPPDAAAQTLTPLPAADAAATADELEDQAEEHSSVASQNDRPESSQKEDATASMSAPPVPAESLLHQITQVPDALPEDSSLVPNPSQQAFSCSVAAPAAMANHAPSSLPPSPAEGITAGQELASSPGAPANLAASPASSVHGASASHLQQLPASLMASMGYPLQGYGMPMPSVNGRDMYQYGGLMVPMMLPGMMLPPPPQQQQHQSRGARSGRGSNMVTNGSGNMNGKWNSVAGPQQAALEQLFPDMRPQVIQQPPYQQQQQQSQQSMAQQPVDILAGDIEQLNQHLHTARVCHLHKAAAAAQGTTTQQPTSDPPLPKPPARGGHQQAGQPRQPDANDNAPPADRGRPKERNDRWPGSNGLYSGRLALSNSPPMTPPYTQNHAVPIPPHPLQQHQAFLRPTRDMRQTQHQQQQRHGYWHPQHQQHAAMPAWQPQPPRSSSVDDLHKRSSPAVSSEASPAVSQPHFVVTTQPQQERPFTEALPQASQLLQASSSGADVGWQGYVNSNPALVISQAQPAISNGVMPSSMVHGPASVDSPPAPRGIWGDGLHQQRLTNLADDLAAVKVAPIARSAAEAPAALSSGNRRETVPSSSRSAGSTPHAGEAQRARGNFPFDNPRARSNNFPFDSAATINKQRRDRFPHNASAHELGQTGSSGAGHPEVAARRDRAPKLSLDSLTSQAEVAQRKQAMAGFDLNTEDFPALGGLAPGPNIATSPGPAAGSKRAPHGKAWSETDALSPPVLKLPPE